MNVGILDLGNSVLSFLALVIDGPFQKNQNLVINSNFLETVKLAVSYHKDNMEMRKRGFDEEETRVEEFYTRLLIVVKGLIEGNWESQNFIDCIKEVLTPKYLVSKMKKDLIIYFDDTNIIS